MKIVTTETTYYTIEELKEVNYSGYVKAHRDYQNDFQFHFTDEVNSSLEKFLDLFNCKLVSWTTNYYQVEYRQIQYIYVDTEDIDETYDEESYGIYELHGKALRKFLYQQCKNEMDKWDYCPLTGVCYDYTLLEPLHQFLTGEKYQDYTLQELIDLACRNLMIEVDSEIDSLMGEEYFIEHCQGNDYYFTIDGDLE